MTDEQKTAAMRTLPENERRRLIDEASNVIGFDRFSNRRNSVDLRDAYRKPPTPGPGGTA